jgi:hypothetical protein
MNVLCYLRHFPHGAFLRVEFEGTTKLFLQASEMGPHTPYPPASGSPPPLVPGGGGTHSLAGQGVGDPNTDEGTCRHCGILSINVLCYLRHLPHIALLRVEFKRITIQAGKTQISVGACNKNTYSYLSSVAF